MSRSLGLSNLAKGVDSAGSIDLLNISYGELDIETRESTTVTISLTNLLRNFLRIDNESFRDPKAIAFTRIDTPVQITLN